MNDYAARFAAVNYALRVESERVVVTGLPGTDREGETFYHPLPADGLEAFLEDLLWQRTWDGYEPLERYIARSPRPEGSWTVA